MMMCAVFYFMVGTHEPVQQYTTAAVPCPMAQAIADQNWGDVYGVVRRVPANFDAEFYRTSPLMLGILPGDAIGQ